MTIAENDLIPSTPNPSYVAIAAAIARGLIQIGAGVGFTWGLTVSGDQITLAATAAVMLGTLIWSGWQKVQAERAKYKAAVASAVASSQATMAAGMPVAVAVEPSPPGTTAADLNRTELARHQGDSR